MSADHEALMDVALAAALKGQRGANPLVGAVLLDDAGEVAAIGHHDGAGSPHAEIAALRQAPQRATGGTLVVTLEPCNHHGRTGPCSQAIIDAGVSRVLYAMADFHGAAAGGAGRLTAAGVEVIAGARYEQAHELNRRWILAKEGHRPFISLQLAQTADGRIAAADGTSQWITGEESRAASHAKRAIVSAMLVGTGTLIADNPRLTARTPSGELCQHQPMRAVMGEREVPADAAIRGDGNWVHLRTRDPHVAASELGRRGVEHVLIEGGASISSAFLAAGLVDELSVTVAPMLLGSGQNSVADLGNTTLAQAQLFDLDPAAPVRVSGQDVVITMLPRREQEN